MVLKNNHLFSQIHGLAWLGLSWSRLGWLGQLCFPWQACAGSAPYVSHPPWTSKLVRAGSSHAPRSSRGTRDKIKCARLLEAYTWKWHTDTSVLFCWPRQVIWLSPKSRDWQVNPTKMRPRWGCECSKMWEAQIYITCVWSSATGFNFSSFNLISAIYPLLSFISFSESFTYVLKIFVLNSW